MTKDTLDTLIDSIQQVLKSDGRVMTAWLYGSTSTLDANSESDVDIIIEFNVLKKYSMFDILDIAHKLEMKINKSVDLVEKGQLKDFAVRSSKKNIQRIYG